MKGDSKGAIENFHKALEINPQLSPQVHMDLARALAADGRNDEAIANLRKALSIYPDSVDLHYYLGLFLAEEGNSMEAIEELRLVLRARPGHQGAQAALGKLGAR
jgi:Flp pilus assembly protein TadD